MDENNWLNYEGQSTSELIALRESHRKDSLVLAFEQGIQSKADRAGFDALTQAEQTVLVVEAVEREVNNGGYRQLFLNQTHEYVEHFVDALHRIGCPVAARLTQDAINALQLEGPASPQAVSRTIQREDSARDALLNDLDDRYYDEVGDLSEALFAWIQAHAEHITLPGGSRFSLYGKHRVFYARLMEVNEALEASGVLWVRFFLIAVPALCLGIHFRWIESLVGISTDFMRGYGYYLLIFVSAGILLTVILSRKDAGIYGKARPEILELLRNSELTLEGLLADIAEDPNLQEIREMMEEDTELSAQDPDLN